MKKIQKNVSLPLLIFILTQFLNWTAYQTIAPILPIYVRDLGFSIADLGLISAALGISLMIFEPLWGMFLNKIGAKKVFLFSILCSTLIVFSYTFINDLIGFIILRFLSGAVGSAGGVSSRVLVRKSFSKGGRAYGTWYTIISIAGLVGPIIGGYAATIASGYNLVFYIATVIGFMALFLGFGIPEIKDTNESGKEEKSKGMTKKEKNTLVYASLLTIIPLFLRFVYTTFMPVFAKESEKFLLNPLEISLAFTIMGLVGLFAPLLFGELSDKIGRKKIIILGMGLNAFTFILLSTTPGVIIIYLTSAILAFGTAAVSPPLMALLTDKILPANQGIAIGVFGAGEDLGILIGPVIVGYVYQNYSAESSFLLTAVVMFINIIISIPLLRKLEQKN
jgi:MFS family permease